MFSMKSMDIKHVLISSMLLMLCSFNFVYAKTLTATQDPWPPFVTKEGTGIIADIVRSALKTQGYDLKITTMPWARALHSVKGGSVDILLGTWFTEKRTKELLYSAPYLQNRLTFVKRVDDTFEYNGLESLEGKRIGVIRGYSYSEDFAQANHFIRNANTTFSANLKMLLAKRLDMVVEDQVVAAYTIKTEKIPNNRIAYCKNQLSIENLHITTGKVNPNSQHYIEVFNKGLKHIQENGTYKKILSQYGF